MKVLANTKDMSREDWLSLRRLGGSEASIILGLNKYKTSYQLWLEKTGEIIPEEIDNDFIHFGNVLEDVVAKEFERRTGKKVRKKNQMLVHPEYEFATANLDRVVVGESALLECKTASEYLKGSWEGEEVPESYLVQVQHYLGVTGYEKAYIAVLIGGNKFVWKEIARDEELIKIIFEAEKHFWEYHVKQKIAPDIDGSDAAVKFMNERYKVSDPSKSVDLGSECFDYIEQLNVLKGQKKLLEGEINLLENNLKNELKEAELGFIKNYSVSWKQVKTNRFDSKKFKVEHPELTEEFTNQTISRRLTIKEMK